MNNEKSEKIVSIIKRVAPEFKDMEDENLEFWVAFVEPYISESKFGALYPQAMAYLVAHKMALNVPASAKDGEVGVSVKDSMNIASYTEGSTSVSFNNSAVSSGASSGADAEYLLTAYGLQFLAIRKQCIVPIAISGMRKV